MPRPRACSICGELEKIGENSSGDSIYPRRSPERKPRKHWFSMEPVVGIGRFNPMNEFKIADLLRKSTSLGKSLPPSFTRCHPLLLTAYLTVFALKYQVEAEASASASPPMFYGSAAGTDSDSHSSDNRRETCKTRCETGCQ